MKSWTPWLRNGLVFGSGTALGFGLALLMAWYRPSEFPSAFADPQLAQVRRELAALETREGDRTSLEDLKAELRAMTQGRQGIAAAAGTEVDVEVVEPSEAASNGSP